MQALAYNPKVLALALLALLGLASARAGYAQENLAANGFPAEWQTQDFEFSLLEPASGQPPATPASIPTQAKSTGLVQTGLAAQTFRIDQLPRTTIAPSGTQPMAIPPAAAGLLAEDALSPNQAAGQLTDLPVGQVFRPLGQAFPPQAFQGVAADLGIIVNEQAIAGAASGVAGLAAYGPLTAAAPENIWLKASQALQTRRLQAATEKPVASAALREEWRRLLLANAAAPQATEGAPHWLAVRAESLEKLGLAEAAWGLWREAGPLLRQPKTPSELLQGWARASLLAGQTEGACALVREQAVAGMVSDFWPCAAAVCAATEMTRTDGGAANTAALALAVQLLPASAMKADPALTAALNAVRDNTPPRLGAWPVGSLAGATLAAVPALLSNNQLTNLPDVALRRLQASPAIGLALRTEAAQLLAGKTQAATDAAQWLVLASSPSLPATLGTNWPDAAVVAWAKAFVQASVNDPSASLAAPVAARVVPAALRLGDLQTATSWWGVYRAEVDLKPEAVRARLQTHLALQLLQGQNVSATLATLANWQAVRGADALANRRTLAVLAGMGQPAAAADWAALQADAPEQTDTLNLAWQNLIEEAAQQQDISAVLSMVTEALRGQNAASAPPAVLQASLAALRAVGLAKTAQRLAAEALTLTASQPTRVLKMQEPVAEALPPLKNGPTVKVPKVPTVRAPSFSVPKAPLLPKPKV